MPAEDKAIETLENIRSLRQKGSSKEALSLFEAKESSFPLISGANFLKGTLFQDIGDDFRALQSYKNEIALDPKCVDAHINMGVIYFKRKKYYESIASFKLSILTAANRFLPYYNLAGVMRELYRLDEAIVYYKRALSIDKDSQEAWINLASVYKKLKNTPKVIECYKELLRINPESASANHILESIGGKEKTLTRADDAYLELLFDTYAPNFEHSLLKKLEYKGPQMVLEVAKKSGILEGKKKAVDLGCGTGLSALAFKEYDDLSFTGVDISEKMLELACAKKIYHKTYKKEIHTYLQETNETYDLALCLDVLPYFGDLESFFKDLTSIMEKKGHFIATIELDDEIKSYDLRPCGRFSHSSSYVESAARANHWQPICVEKVSLRLNEEVPVPGAIFIFAYLAP